jgi:hypothetical protein
MDDTALEGDAFAFEVCHEEIKILDLYRWRQKFGLKIEQVKLLKDLELENSRLRKAVSDLTLDKLILQEAARGKFQAPRVAVPALSRSGAATSSRQRQRLMEQRRVGKEPAEKLMLTNWKLLA